MRATYFFIAVCSFCGVMLIAPNAIAASPLLSFTPLTQTSFVLAPYGQAVIQYEVQNHSVKTHTLVMKSIPGVIQITSGQDCSNPVILGAKQSCRLNLLVNANTLSNNLNDGPVLCQTNIDGTISALLCYRPQSDHRIYVKRQAEAFYNVNSNTDANGTVNPSTVQLVPNGGSLTFTAIANNNYAVYKWLVDGAVMQWGGNQFELKNINQNHQVSVSFTNQTLFYAATHNDMIYYSYDQGLTWFTTFKSPANGVTINSILVADSVLYSANSNGIIYYSFNNGGSWSSMSSPDSSAINSIYLENNTLYAATQTGFIYYTNDRGINWTATNPPDGSAVTAVSVANNVLFSGTANGLVYRSNNNGITWLVVHGVVDGSPIKSLFVNRNSIYAGTEKEFAYSTSVLEGAGTWNVIAQTVYSLFVSAFNEHIYGGTQNGSIYSISTGIYYGLTDYVPINSIYIVN